MHLRDWGCLSKMKRTTLNNAVNARLQKTKRALATLSDDVALGVLDLFPEYAVGTEYEVDDRFLYNNDLYRVVQTHTSQSDWEPDKTPALYTKISKPGEIDVWKQPTGVQDAYRIGDRVHFPTENDSVYENDVDYNVYAPNVTGWHEVMT